MTAAAVAGAQVGTLLDPATIRRRCANILAAADAGEARHFRVDRGRVAAAADRVARVTRRRYPDLAIPYHSRWRHFEAGGVDRAAALARALAGRDAAACARARIDLAVISVLLDAGAGAAWRYVEPETGQSFMRSEGLGVASFRAFMAGAFSAHADDPLRVDAAALRDVDAASRQVIADAGHAEHFGHGLGHGVGIEVHEAPRLARTGKDALVPGNVVTVEPGVYLAGRGGVRIEDTLVVRAGEPELLTLSTKNLVVV